MTVEPQRGGCGLWRLLSPFDFGASGDVVGFAVGDDCADADAENLGDFFVDVAGRCQGAKLVFLAVEDGLFGTALGTLWTAEDDTFGALSVEDVEAAADLHAALDFDEVAEMVHKERHRTIRVEGAGVAEGDKGAAICEQVLHDLEENRKAAAEGGDVVGDDGVSWADGLQKGLQTVRLDFTGEVIFDPGVGCDVVGFAP